VTGLVTGLVTERIRLRSKFQHLTNHAFFISLAQMESEHDGSLRFRHRLLALIIDIGRRVRPSLAPHVFRLTPNIVVKIGTSVQLSEAVAMRLVGSHTTIPVPHIIDAFQGAGGIKYIVMEHCQRRVAVENLAKIIPHH
jgi:hypothetical protein